MHADAAASSATRPANDNIATAEVLADGSQIGAVEIGLAIGSGRTFA